MIKILLIKDDIIGWVNPAVIKNVILLTKQNKMEVYTIITAWPLSSGG